MEALIVACVTFLGAEVAKKLANEVTSDLWVRLKKGWAKRFKSEPQPREVTASLVASLAEMDSGIADGLQHLLSETPILRRLQRVRDVVKGARVLWIDDHPEWNSWEIALVESLGAQVRTAETTRSAKALIGKNFDIVISDIAREGNDTEGIDSLPSLRSAAPKTPVVFYVGQLQASGVPAGAFGITNRPDELFHLILDILERTRS
jgi:CheY-like chemotaxis protein